jgi:preprotein translocase subunit SecY
MMIRFYFMMKKLPASRHYLLNYSSVLLSSVVVILSFVMIFSPNTYLISCRSEDTPLDFAPSSLSSKIVYIIFILITCIAFDSVLGFGILILWYVRGLKKSYIQLLRVRIMSYLAIYVLGGIPLSLFFLFTSFDPSSSHKDLNKVTGLIISSTGTLVFLLYALTRVSTI